MDGGPVIRVTVELIPGGIGEPQHLGTMTISNQTGAGRARIADYMVRFYNKRRVQTLRGGRVTGHRRLAEPVWNLVAKALEVGGYATDA